MNRAATVAALIAAAAAGAACGDDGAPSTDAGAFSDAGVVFDAGLNRDGAQSLSWVDFTISGCAIPPEAPPGPTSDAGVGPAAPCYGTAPLELQFTAVAPAPVEVYVWTFGDDEMSDEASPTHTYALPGDYEVSLTVGGQGTADVVRPMAVVVQPAQLGDGCAVEQQCDPALECVCDDQTLCPPSLAGGLCTADCSDQSPCADGVCADLAPADPGSPADWERALCLPACDVDACPGDLVCREVLAGDGDGWVEACLPPGLLGDIGDSCADSDGNPDDTVCTSGVCLDEGARGVCSEPCTAGTCPASAACATFVDGAIGSWCVARCEGAGDCTSDPLLSCNAPGGGGDKDFAVDEMPPAAMGYCTPTPCTMPTECGLQGTCTDGFCAPL